MIHVGFVKVIGGNQSVFGCMRAPTGADTLPIRNNVNNLLRWISSALITVGKPQTPPIPIFVAYRLVIY